MSSIISPSEHLGFEVGEDRKLADWPQIVEYFYLLDSASERVRTREIGKTTEGNPFLMAIISSPENLANLKRYQAIQSRLADPRTIRDEHEADELIAEGKAVVAITCSIHSTEVGASQMSMLAAYHLATSDDDDVRRILENVIVLLVPSLNPDGLILVKKWYDSTLGTPHEGVIPPVLYHKYTGHDNNRDWFMLTQVETQIMNRVHYKEWFPQIIYDVHQMGNKGARFFVPPFFDPLNPNVPPLLQRQIMLIGAHMAHDLQAAGKQGVITSAVYDMWWHGGYRTAPYRHNIVGMLTEAASVRIASPVFQLEKDLKGHRRGLPKYWLQANFPDPWQGGWWRLRDIVEYQKIASNSLLKLAATHKEDWLYNFYQLGKTAVTRGEMEPPFAFLIPPAQHDPIATYEMTRILSEGGVELHRAEKSLQADGVTYPAGTTVILMSQPYRAHAKDLLERQRYPNRRIGGDEGEPERPYDVTGWTLPLQMGVRTIDVVTPFKANLSLIKPALPNHAVASSNSGYYLQNRTNHDVLALNRLLAKGYAAYWTEKPTKASGRPIDAGAIWLPSRDGLQKDLTTLARETGIEPLPGKKPDRGYRLAKPRLGLYQPWTSNMDEGWTRWVLERYEFDYRTIHDAEIKAGNLGERYEVIILPNGSPSKLMEGNAPGTMPLRFVGGIGEQGADNILAFVRAGGTLICLGDASRFAIERFDLNVDLGLDDSEDSDPFYAPGSILQVNLDTSHPLSFGRRSPQPIYFAQNPVFDVSGSASSVADYPEFNPLMSGWILGNKQIQGKSALVDAPLGEGRVILFGFRPQHRAQPHATFKIFFNAIYYGTATANVSVR
ncbi:MAG: peptidase M14 [Chloroflexi bacterium]|nr:peptidase M14 [Chloroflexota bacterium]